MTITNKMGLPAVFERIMSQDDDHKPETNRYSVTELLMPIRMLLIRRANYDKIERDVADGITALLGTAVHAIFEGQYPIQDDRHLREAAVEAKVGRNVLSGRIDLLNLEDLAIEDYKTCSANKVIKKDFDDWYKQGMMYAWIVGMSKNVIVRKLRFYAIMKDWSKVKSATSANYPPAAVYVWEYDIQDSDYDYIEKWIHDRLDLINWHVDNGTLPECADEERWSTGDKWAVYKKAGDKRAAIVCDTEREAHEYITEKCGGVGQIEFRKGDPLRCKYYCDCCKLCSEGGK